MVLLSAWEQLTVAEFAYDKKKRWLVFKPNYDALAYFQERPEILGEINARHVRVLLRTIDRLNKLAAPKTLSSTPDTQSQTTGPSAPPSRYDMFAKPGHGPPKR